MLALAIIMSALLATRMVGRLFAGVVKEDAIDVLCTLLIEGALFQSILWILYAHT